MQFSIIIPAMNEEANIGRCLDSILAVDWERSQYEIMVIDNGSSDRTVAIAREKEATVFVRPGYTISALRNFGASRASGEVLAFIDADCTVDESWLKGASRYLGRREVVCFGSPPAVPERATWVQAAWFAVRRKGETVCPTAWLESMNMFVRRETFSRCGGFDESLVTCEDYDLSLRLGTIGSLINDGRIIAIHHGEAATVAHFFRKELWRGRSNFAGLRQHGFRLSEFPSLVAPSLHCLLMLVVAASLFTLPRGGSRYAVGLMLAWQAMLLLKSFRKQCPSPRLPRVLQLYCLLNVYLFARGISVFQGR